MTIQTRLAHSSKHSWTKKFSWFGEFLSTVHTWLHPHRMVSESVDERKWENCLQMDIDTITRFWGAQTQDLYCTNTCVSWFASAFLDWDGCIRLCFRCNDHSIWSPNRFSFWKFQRNFTKVFDVWKGIVCHCAIP